MERSKIPMHKCAIVNIVTTNLKSISSMKLHRGPGITQKSAWFILHRIRQAYEVATPVMNGPVEIDDSLYWWQRAKQAGRAAGWGIPLTISGTAPIAQGSKQVKQRHSPGKPGI